MSKSKFNRLVSTSSVNRPELKEFPKPPELLKSKQPERAAALTKWYQDIEEWRKGFLQGSTADIQSSIQKILKYTMQIRVSELEATAATDAISKEQLNQLILFILNQVKLLIGKDNGIAGLDVDGTVPLDQLPASVKNKKDPFNHVLFHRNKYESDPFQYVLYHFNADRRPIMLFSGNDILVSRMKRGKPEMLFGDACVLTSEEF